MKPPPIVIVSNPVDVHAFAVSTLLKREFDRESVILDLSDYPVVDCLSATVGQGGCSSRFSASGIGSLTDEHTVWWRRPGRFGIDDGVSEPHLRQYILDECRTTIDGILYASGCRIVNDRQAEDRAANKVFQLAVASRCGFRIPETIVTNDREDVQRMLAEHSRIVYKRQAFARYHMAETRLFDEAARSQLDSLVLCPVTFQEYIAGSIDLRVTVVGDKVFCARIDTEGSTAEIDWRLDLMAPMEPVEPPAEIATLSLRTTKALGLDFGAMDIRLTSDDEPVFFEVNTAGQFLFCERDDDLPITRAVCELLCA